MAMIMMVAVMAMVLTVIVMVIDGYGPGNDHHG